MDRDEAGRQSDDGIDGGLKIQTPEIEDDCATVQTDITLINDSAQKREVRILTQILDADGKEAAALP